ncbi:MAG TPA: NAD(P)-dependent oxidoreductase [Thermoplasmata archaeon]|nr:NAD(P)-dependent oxidoreductase [Thermoplasmata archaeon]
MIASESARAPPVGFVGLGRMGGPIVGRLLAQGSAVVVWNRTREKAEPLLAAGARWANSPSEVARAVGPHGTVGVLVRDARAARGVLLGRRGVAHGAAPGTLVVHLSTISPAESRALAERLAARGIHYLEAPVSGSTAAAGAGALLVFAGGSPDDLERARPLLQPLARRIERVGDVGQGAAMKLVQNHLTIGYVALAAEALAVADALRLDRRATLDLLLDGGGGSALLERKRDRFERREYAPEFALDLAEKDLKLIERAGRDGGRPTRILREARRLAEEAIRGGHGAEDFSVVFEAALGRGGPSPPAPPKHPASAEPAPAPAPSPAPPVAPPPAVPPPEEPAPDGAPGPDGRSGA